MLKMRWLLLVLMLTAGSAWSGDPQVPKRNAGSQQAKTEQRGSENAPVFVRGDVITKQDKAESDRDAKDRELKAGIDAALVKYTLWAAILTGCMFFAAALQVGLFVWQLTLMRIAVRDGTIAANSTKESADALISSSMPILFPTIVNMAALHPLIPIATPYTHDSNIFIKFENFGGTPATIREVRAKLYLTLKDIPPLPSPSDWPKFLYPVMIPGNSRAADQHFGALDMKQTIVYGQSEIVELHSEADPEGIYRRFVLMGQVIYDDFFGWRHVRTFCVKLRAWVAYEGGPLNQFQVGMGGSAYNKWTKEKTPNPDPLEYPPS